MIRPGEPKEDMFLVTGTLKRNGRPAYASLCRSSSAIWGDRWCLQIWVMDPYAYGAERLVLERDVYSLDDADLIESINTLQGEARWTSYLIPLRIASSLGWEESAEREPPRTRYSHEVTDEVNLYKLLHDALGDEDEDYTASTMMGAHSYRRWDCGCRCDREAFASTGTLFDRVSPCEKHEGLLEPVIEMCS